MRKIFVSFIITAIIAGSISFDLSAQETYKQIPPMVTDRPTQTESPYTIPKGFLQIEGGFLYEYDNLPVGNTQLFNFSNTVLRFGISDRAEIRAGVNYLKFIPVSQQDEIGLGPLQIGSKFRIGEEKGFIPEISLDVTLGLPFTGDQIFKPDYFAPSFLFAFQHTLSPKISLGYNLGASWDGVNPWATGIYSLSCGYSISNKVNVFGELYGSVPEKGDAWHQFDAGMSWLIMRNFQVDVSAGTALNAAAPDYFVATGLSVRLPR
ncbi:MAG TPA: transporter [Bacteroidales bacterium]|nr:transporter [Bacteroidales bacterium]